VSAKSVEKRREKTLRNNKQQQPAKAASYQKNLPLDLHNRRTRAYNLTQTAVPSCLKVNDRFQSFQVAPPAWS
jgi:hypothetical protein